MRCFVHFDLQMCFAPQRRAIFRDRNFQKWSKHALFCTFWLANALRATAAWNFQIVTSKLAPTLRCFVPFDLQMRFAPQLRAIFSDRHFKNGWGVLCILTWKCASRHSGVPFIISLRNSYLHTRRFSEPTFRTPWPRISENTQRFATFLTFGACGASHVDLSCWSFVFWLDFSTLLFNCPYCRKLDF